MSTTKNLSQKEAPQPEAICVSNRPLTIGVTSGSLMAASGNWEQLRIENLRSDHLLHEVFKTPVDVLIDLWVCKYGHEWTGFAVLSEDPFFELMYHRLKQLGELEVHYLTDRAEYVCRVPE